MPIYNLPKYNVHKPSTYHQELYQDIKHFLPHQGTYKTLAALVSTIRSKPISAEEISNTAAYSHAHPEELDNEMISYAERGRGQEHYFHILKEDPGGDIFSPGDIRASLVRLALDHCLTYAVTFISGLSKFVLYSSKYTPNPLERENYEDHCDMLQMAARGLRRRQAHYTKTHKDNDIKVVNLKKMNY